MLGVEDRIDLHLGTCSKALATTGGFVAGDAAVIKFLKFNAPTMLFTKAMPACVAAATLESLRLLRKGHRRRKKLWRNTAILQNGLRAAGYDIGSTQTPITPILGNGTDAVHISNVLFRKYNIWASAVLYPAVPIGTSILRVIPTANHSRADLEYFLHALSRIRPAAGEAVEMKIAASS
jgi:7-keto-8-aminopelargonate synthetase-like enzyme